jgi:hypothetical protein
VRRFAAALGIALLVLGAAAALAVVWRIELASAVVRYGLERSGFPDAAFAVETVELDRLVLVGIEAENLLRAERLELDLDLARLPALPIERIRLVAPEVDLSTHREPPASENGEPAAASSREPELPLGILPVLQIERGTVRLSSPVGPLVLTVDSTVEPRPGFVEMTLRGELTGEGATALLRISARLDEAGPVSISVDLDAVTVRSPALSIDRGAATLRLGGRAAGLDLRHAEGVVEASLGGVVAGETPIGDVATTLPFALAKRDERWTATLSQTALRLPGFDLDASGIAGEVSLEGVDLQVARLVDRRRSRRFEPIALRLRVPKTEPDVPFSVEVAAAGGRLTIRGFGRFEPATKTIRAEVVWPRFRLAPDGIRPRDLSPLLGFDGTVAGGCEGRAVVTWTAKRGLTGNATVVVDDATVATETLRAEGLSGRIAVERFEPLATAGVQEWRAREIHPGVALADATLRFALEPAAKRGSLLRIERFECGFAGGRITVDAAVIDPAAEQNDLEFRFAEVGVAELFGIAAIDGVSGSGTLSGRVPVAVRGADLAIPGGRLTSTKGVLRIRSEAVAGFLAGGGESTALLLDALRDFHYDSLEVAIEKSFTGETEIVLRLEGSNPAVLRGHPFRLNLNLSGNLDRLVGSLLEVARLSDRAVRATVEAAR